MPGETSHVEKARQEQFDEILQVYLKAEDKQAFESGLLFNDFKNQFLVHRLNALTYVEIMTLEAVLMFNGGTGSSIIPGVDGALAITAGGNKSLLTAGTVVTVANGNIIFFYDPSKITSYYDNIKKAAASEEESEERVYKPND